MDRVEEIETAIGHLGPDEFRQLSVWMHALEAQRWDKQMDDDSQAGRLDALFQEAEDELAQGSLREWPPPR